MGWSLTTPPIPWCSGIVSSVVVAVSGVHVSVVWKICATVKAEVSTGTGVVSVIVFAYECAKVFWVSTGHVSITL